MPHFTSTLLRMTLCTSLVWLTACGGCGDDQTGTGTSSNTGNQDMGQGTSPDGGGGGGGGDTDMAIAPPAGAVYVVVEATPIKTLHRPGDEVTLVATAYDQDDQPRADEALTWRVSPEGSATQGAEGKWMLVGEGEIMFEACLDSNPETCGSQVLLSDQSPPAIMLLEPSPGQEIDGQQQPTITVRGIATDATGVFVNGQPMELDPEGNFSTTLTPTFGINHIKAVATDDRQRRTGDAELDVLYGEAFYETLGDGTSGTRFEDGLLLHLGQRFFDDNSTPMALPDGTTITEDLADILSLLLKEIDLLSLVPNPIASGDELTLSIERIDLGPTTINLRVVEEGLELYLSAPNLEVDTTGFLEIEGARLGLDGGISAGISVLATISIDKLDADTPFVVEVDALDVAIENATSDFEDEQADAVFTLAESALRLQLEHVITDTLKDSFIDALPELLGGALNGLEDALSGQTFPLDAMLGNSPVDVTFAGAVQNAQKDPRRAITIDIDATLKAEAAPTKTSLGVAMMQAYEPYRVDLIEQGRIQIALRLGLINGLLHGLWNANFLEIDASSILPDDLKGVVKEARISAQLPPLVRPPARGEPHDLFLELGQLELELRTALGDQLVTYGVNLGAGVDLSLEDNELRLTISEDPEVTIWVIDTADGKPATLGPDELGGLFRDLLWPQLTSSLGEGLSLPLPVLDLSQLGEFAPTLNAFELSFEQLESIDVRDGFLVIHANLAGKLPVTP